MKLVTTSTNDTGPALAANDRVGIASAGQIHNVISSIRADHIFGDVGGILQLSNILNWRVDRQNAPAGETNISIQRNDVRGRPSTVATVFVNHRYNLGNPPHDPGLLYVFQARMRQLERVVRQGLEKSFATYAAPANTQNQPNLRVITRFRVKGDFSC